MEGALLHILHEIVLRQLDGYRYTDYNIECSLPIESLTGRMIDKGSPPSGSSGL
ncbi:hypothetical protein GCM10022278_18510 [Allohahella marinimesophila]|uniref:Uncharacterized protein n=1 Tax=Allohahella marinimesophila TaxID=1054972 RepID=A0ABP7P970_9GAMM